MGPEPLDRTYPLFAVSGLADDLDSGFVVEQCLEPGSDHGLVVDDDDPNAHRLPSGSRACTAKLPSLRVPDWNEPP